MSKWSLNGCEALNYIFLTKISLGYQNFRGNLKIMHFEPIFPLIPQV